uniref:WAT1-related protein n=1 Tax=Picea sitchensis TaxID=3332 RepID=D5ADE6_PICSI|nr:unknown [Picea sitchensis]
MKSENWTLGCIYLLGNCLAWSGWIVIQAPVLKKYPARLSVTSFTCLFGIMQFLAIAAFFERDPSHWKMRSGGEVFTVLYAGIVASGIAFSVQIWCIDRGGPVFVAVYQPVQTIAVAIMASIILGEQFYLGGIIGAILIIAGLYLVLWGKSEEKRLNLLTKAIMAPPQSSTPHEHDEEEASPITVTNNNNTAKHFTNLTQPLLHGLKRNATASASDATDKP